MKTWIPLLAAMMGIASPGCFVGVDRDGHYADDAIFTVEWRIEGSADRDACLDFDAAYAYLTIESRYGTEDDRTVRCEEFGYDFYVPPGRYWATVTLLDPNEHEITTTIQTDPETLYENDGTYVVADFPADSFL
jgi:hypothetical protein